MNASSYSKSYDNLNENLHKLQPNPDVDFDFLTFKSSRINSTFHVHFLSVVSDQHHMIINQKNYHIPQNQLPDTCATTQIQIKHQHKQETTIRSCAINNQITSRWNIKQQRITINPTTQIHSTNEQIKESTQTNQSNTNEISYCKRQTSDEHAN